MIHGHNMASDAAKIVVTALPFRRNAMRAPDASLEDVIPIGAVSNMILRKGWSVSQSLAGKPCQGLAKATLTSR